MLDHFNFKSSHFVSFIPDLPLQGHSGGADTVIPKEQPEARSGTKAEVKNEWKRN